MTSVLCLHARDVAGDVVASVVHFVVVVVWDMSVSGFGMWSSCGNCCGLLYCI